MDDQNILRNCRPPMGCLLINGKRYPTYKGINTVGRCISATVALKNLDISKQHAIITVVGENGHYISDFESYNGTFLKDYKLSPLLLYKLVENSTINFGSVTATYNMFLTKHDIVVCSNSKHIFRGLRSVFPEFVMPRIKVTPATYEDYYLKSFYNTQTATQSLYDSNTQAVEKEISIRYSSPNVQQENLFDDDYSFDDISTQMINESANSTRPVFKIPFSIHEVPTQEVCSDNTSLIVDDVTDIHNMETQKLDLNPTIKIDEHLNINEIPTQILTLENEKQNFDTTSIIDETVLNNSNFEVPEVIISESKETTEDSDSQSALHVSQLHRRSTKPISDSEESDPNISEVICSTQTSDEVIKYKRKRRFVIESDSETDVENLDENTKNDLRFDIVKLGSLNHPVPKTLHRNSVARIESDSDVDNFEFNAHSSDQSKSDNSRSSKNYENSIDNDDIIPGTQFNEEVSNENTVKNTSKMINSVDDMDSLYLEATQIIEHDTHTDKKNVSDCESVCKPSVELIEQAEECNTNLIEPEVNSILEKLNQFSSKIVKRESNISKNDHNELDHNQSQNEDLLLVQTKPKPSVMETPQIIRVDSSPFEADNLCFEETQPIGIDQQKISERVKGNDKEFLKHNQPVIMTNDENCNQMKGINEVESYRSQQKEFGTMKKSDDIFLEPTQPLTVVNDQKNKKVKRIQSTINPHQEQHDNAEETDDIFLEPTQPLHFDNDQKSKTVKDANDVFLQPIQSILSLHGEILDNTGKTDDVFLEPTQPLNVFNDQRSKRVKTTEDVFLKPTQSILSPQQEQPENTGEADDVCLDVTPTTVIAKDKKGIEDLEDIFHEPTQPILEGINDITNIHVEGSDMKPAIPKNGRIKDGTEKDQIILEYSGPINIAINQNDHDKKKTSLAQKINSLENLTNVGINTTVENKLEEIFATQKFSTDNEIQSQFEVLFESQNVYYRSDISNRPTNPLLNEFENRNRKEFLNTDDLGTNSKTPTPLVAEEVQKNLPNTDLNITNCIEDGSKNYYKPKRLSLSLKSNLRLGSGREIKSYEKLSKIPNNFCKIDEVETTNSTEEPTNSISKKPNNSKISKSKSINEKFKKIVHKNSNACTEEVKSSTFNDDTVRLMRSARRLRNSKTTNLTDITKSPQMVDLENDSGKCKKTRTPSTRSRTTIQNNLDDDIHIANLQETESPKTSKCTRTSTSSKNQNKGTESKEINVSATSSNSRKLEKGKASKVSSVKRTETKEATINQDDLYTNSCKAANEVDTNISKKSPTKFTYDQLNNPSRNTKKRKKLASKSQEANIHTIRKTRRVEFDAIETKSVQLTPLNRKKRILTDVPGTSQTKQRKNDVEEVNVVTPVKSVSPRQTPAMDNATPDRNKRKLKPKVVFTMLDSPELESVIRSLGGTVVNSVESCTVLVTANLKRTKKLLAAVGQSKPICSPKWLQDSKKARQFLDPWEYILEDKDAESIWNISLKQSLLKSRTQKLLRNYLIYVAVTNSVDVLKAAIESCGGKCVTKAPNKLNNENFIIVANPENKSKYSKFLKRDPPVQIVLPEAIFDGVLRQELKFQNHLLL